ncbi:SAM-dependent methyltransferase [Bacillus sp. BRMEA1]|uniref:class I SAM-dependent methyltransferase n=1 Tax=Neobacillus endophyticus TaxID=2738405 RepID=UPI001563B6EB|nr:SAM-dependent methyltransferase [Neobacillus endophyticus]NRD80744.1 SAM-dependent methyltransferase [Neobacillus endophyticus]
MLTYLKNFIGNSPSKLISYADFIEAALYHPVHGYYMKERQKIGRQGDFITTSNISDLYGRQVAKWFSYLCENMSLPPVFCEIGGGTGRFAQAFLHEWADLKDTPLQYYIVETSPYHRKLQEDLKCQFPAIVNLESIEELKDFEGMIFSNELFDALPVHVIQKQDGSLFEVMIGIENETLFELKVPLTNPDILNFLEESNLVLNDEQRIEVPIAMEKMLQAISGALTKGMVVTVDYGYTFEEWKHPARRKGSLRGYYQQQMIENILKYPGEMDITSHIHLDYLLNKGEQVNLAFLAKMRQDEFLLKTGILKELESHFDPNPFSEVSKRNRSIRSLIMPDGISSYFQIVIQQKNMELQKKDLFAE